MYTQEQSRSYLEVVILQYIPFILQNNWVALAYLYKDYTSLTKYKPTPR